MIYPRPNSMMLQTKPLHDWNILPSAGIIGDHVKPNSCQLYIFRGNCPYFVGASAQTTCLFKFSLLIRLNENQMENEPYSHLIMLLEKCWQEFCGHKLTLQTERLILNVDGNILLKLLWHFFFYYSSSVPLCPWLKFALYSFLAVFKVAVVNLHVALHPRGNCTSLVF